MSDLHLEARINPFTFVMDLPLFADVLVLAGDITSPNMIAKDLELFAGKWKHVVYVTGNHEHWDSSIDKVHVICTDIAERFKNVHYLNKSSVTIDDVTIHGAPLWYGDYPNAPRTVRDFTLIKDLEPQVYDENDAAKRYFWNNIKPGDVVVTHHTPSYNSGSEEFKEAPDNCWYHNNMDSLLMGTQPAVWIHGHVHHTVDYEIIEGGTRVLANPAGIEDSIKFGNADFDSTRIVEIL